MRVESESTPPYLIDHSTVEASFFTEANNRMQGSSRAGADTCGDLTYHQRFPVRAEAAQFEILPEVLDDAASTVRCHMFRLAMQADGVASFPIAATAVVVPAAPGGPLQRTRTLFTRSNRKYEIVWENGVATEIWRTSKHIF